MELALDDDMRQQIDDEVRKHIREKMQEYLDVKREEDQLLSREKAAEMLGIKPNTLAVWSTKGTGPAPTKVGSKSMYRKSVLDAYISENTMPR